MRHLDRYGPVAYFYELAGIMGRLESLMTNPIANLEEGGLAATEAEIEDKLLDLGNYASFIYDWIQAQKAQANLKLFQDQLP